MPRDALEMEALTGASSAEMIDRQDIWRAFYPAETRRTVLAELIVQGATTAVLQERYAGHARPSSLVPGAFEGQDFFPSFGSGGKHLRFMAAPLHDVAGNVVGAIETLVELADGSPD